MRTQCNHMIGLILTAGVLGTGGVFEWHHAEQDADPRLNIPPVVSTYDLTHHPVVITYDPWTRSDTGKDKPTPRYDVMQGATNAPPVAEIDQQAMQKLLDGLQLQIDLLSKPRKREDIRVDRLIDVDGDGQIDLQLEWNGYRGPMSTYGANWFVSAKPHCRLLRFAKPFADGDRVTISDIVHHHQRARLFSAGGSLMYPETHMREFSGGPWYNTTGALVVFIEHGDRLGIGQVIMTVDELGTITIGDTRVDWMDELIEITVPPHPVDPNQPNQPKTATSIAIPGLQDLKISIDPVMIQDGTVDDE